ncbi:MAG: response regulator [Ilumatobacteraceae bacterium]
MKTTRILVADDDRDILDLLSFLLTHAGYTVVGVSDGIAAIAAIESNPPELAILDVMMPGLSGIEVLRRVRQNESVKDLTIILLTVLSSDSDAAAGLDAGANEYVTKPPVLSELLKTVQSNLAKKSNIRISGASSTPSYN